MIRNEAGKLPSQDGGTQFRPGHAHNSLPEAGRIGRSAEPHGSDYRSLMTVLRKNLVAMARGKTPDPIPPNWRRLILRQGARKEEVAARPPPTPRTPTPDAGQYNAGRRAREFPPDQVPGTSGS